MDGNRKSGVQAPPAGPFRSFLKLLVELDSSRFALHRVKSAVLLLALLFTFGLVGYAVPAWLSAFF